MLAPNLQARPSTLIFIVNYITLLSTLPLLSSPRIQINRYELSQDTINTQLQITYNQPFNQSLIRTAHFIEDINVQASQIFIDHTMIALQQSKMKIKFEFKGFRTGANYVDDVMVVNQKIIMVIMLTDFTQGFEINVQEQLEVKPIQQALIQYSSTFPQQDDPMIQIYGLCFPLLFEIKQSTTNSTLVTVNTSPTLIFGSQIALSYIVVSKKHILFHIFCIFDQVRMDSPNYILLIDDENYITNQQSKLFIAVKGLTVTGNQIIVEKYSNFDFFYSPSSKKGIKIGYKTFGGIIDSINSGVITFNNEYDGCSTSDGRKGYFAYEKLYQTVPSICIPCDWTCKTCTGASDDLWFTDSQFCTSCQLGRYYQVIEQLERGQCHCLKGLQVDQNGACIPCQINCLTFNPQLMKASTDPKFLLIFTYSELIFDVQLSQNLLISINQQQIQYNLSEHRKGAYLIEINQSYLIPCQDSCKVTFYIQTPHFVRTEDKFLTEQQKIMEIRNFYVVEKQMPKQLGEVFTVVGSVISISAAAGQSSFLKVLFQLEQLIQIHKYLNLDIPVVFKEFVEALATFRFMDILSIIPFDINSYMQNLASNRIDLKGSGKIVYYESGVNFYKNTIPIILSFLSIIVINFFIFFLLRIMPCSLCQNLANKIRLRWIITLSDMVESLILPIIFFSLHQSTYVLWSHQLVWVYALSYSLSLILLLFPFICIVYSSLNKEFKKDPVMKEILEDLFQDCKLEYTMTYVTYVYSFYRKVLSAIFLLSPIPGFVQILGLLMTNIIQFLIIIYLVKQGIFLSKVKVVTRSINIICVVSIQILIMAYNINYSQLNEMILIGIACTYFSIISTVMGLIEMFIKLGDIAFQKLRKTLSQTTIHPQFATQRYIRNAECKIGKPLQDSKKEARGSTPDQKFGYEDDLSNLSELIPVQSEDGFTNYQESLHIGSQELMKKKDNRNSQKQLLYDDSQQSLSQDKRSRRYNKLSQQSQNTNSLYRRRNKKSRKVRRQRQAEGIIQETDQKKDDSMSDIIEIDYHEEGNF